MTLYARLHPDTGLLDVRDLEEPPKATKGWKPLSIAVKPEHSPTQEVREGEIAFMETEAIQLWVVVEKPPEDENTTMPLSLPKKA